MEHYETRTSVLEGKAMVVAMSRDIWVSLFDEIIKLRPEWAGTKLTKDCATTIKAGRRRQLKLPSWEGGFSG